MHRKMSSYVTGILMKLFALAIMFVGFLLFLYSMDISQENGALSELSQVASWVLVIVGLIMFATAVLLQRRALRRMRSRTGDVHA